jgi:lysylphosphatidylglycerol synthetase-like protein (DUF2156 family)
MIAVILSLASIGLSVWTILCHRKMERSLRASEADLVRALALMDENPTKGGTP